MLGPDRRDAEKFHIHERSTVTSLHELRMLE